MCTATQQQRVPAARTRASRGLNELDSVILDETSTYQCQVEVRKRICNDPQVRFLWLCKASKGHVGHLSRSDARRTAVNPCGVCPDTDASDQKKATSWHFLHLSPSTRSPSSPMVSPLLITVYITLISLFLFGSYLFFTCFLFFFFLVFGRLGRLAVIEGDWRGLPRLDWQDLRSIIKGRKCSNEKVARVGADWGPVNILKSVHEIHWLLYHVYPFVPRVCHISIFRVPGWTGPQPDAKQW